VVKAHDLLTRQGTLMPQRTLHRYAREVLGVGRSAHSLPSRNSLTLPSRNSLVRREADVYSMAPLSCRAPG
jgi:hypothetical protein